MSLQTDQRTGLDELEALDFDYDPPCEHSLHRLGVFGHRGPAWALGEVLMPCGCDSGPRFLYVCKGAWEGASSAPFVCPDCDRGPFAREQAWRFVALVRP